MLRLFQTLGIFNDNLHLISAYHVYLENLHFMEKNKSISYAKNFHPNSKIDKDSAIVVRNLSFKYFNSEDYIFKNLDLVIPKGKHTIITGTNGSGKALIRFVVRVFYAETGSVKTHSSRLGFVGASPMIINRLFAEFSVFK